MRAATLLGTVFAFVLVTGCSGSNDQDLDPGSLTPPPAETATPESSAGSGGTAGEVLTAGTGGSDVTSAGSGGQLETSPVAGMGGEPVAGMGGAGGVLTEHSLAGMCGMPSAAAGTPGAAGAPEHYDSDTGCHFEQQCLTDSHGMPYDCINACVTGTCPAIGHCATACHQVGVACEPGI